MDSLVFQKTFLWIQQQIKLILSYFNICVSETERGNIAFSLHWAMSLAFAESVDEKCVRVCTFAES